MHGIIISPMIYNVKRIYICLSDIFKLFQDFSREIQAIIRPHTNSHTILRFTTKRHIKRKKDIAPILRPFFCSCLFTQTRHMQRRIVCRQPNLSQSLFKTYRDDQKKCTLFHKNDIINAIHNKHVLPVKIKKRIFFVFF